MSWLFINRKTTQIQNGIKLSPNVNSLDTVKFVLKTCVNLRNYGTRDTFLSRSHVTVTVSSEFSVVSAEFQSKHCATFRGRFKSMTLCHQVCLVRIRVYQGKCRLLLLHDVLHEQVHQNYMIYPSPTSFGCRCLRRLIVTRVASCPSSFKRCFVTIPSEIPAFKAWNSASAELRLTAVFLTKQKELRLSTA